MNISNVRSLLTALILLFASGSIAGTFTPQEGATITTDTLSVTWSSSGSQQWVRIFNSSGDKIYDSGRLSSASGQVGLDIPENSTSISVTFYEKGEDGRWSSTARTYQVAIDDGSEGGGSSEGSVSSEQIISALEDVFCGESNELTRTNTGRIACHPKDSSGCPVIDIEVFRGDVISDRSDYCAVSAPNIDGRVEDGIVTLLVNTLEPETYGVNGFEARLCAIALGCENYSPLDF